MGLVDELRLLVYPVVFGAGDRLFGETQDKIPLRLVESRPFRGGVVSMIHAPARRTGDADSRDQLAGGVTSGRGVDNEADHVASSYTTLRDTTQPRGAVAGAVVPPLSSDDDPRDGHVGRPASRTGARRAFSARSGEHV